MVNCEEACREMVQNYAKTGLIKSFSLIILWSVFLFQLGCGKTIGGSKTVYKYDAGGCGKGVGRQVYTCA